MKKSVNLNLDPKHRIQTIDEFRVLAKDPKKIIEYTNALANWCRYYLGINTIPAAWQVIDAEMKFIPCDPWNEDQTKLYLKSCIKSGLKLGISAVELQGY